jgi:hypothetical protein
MMFLPSLEGSVTIRAPARAFVTAFARRIEAGLFGSAPGPRSRYAVIRADDTGLAFRAIDWPTAMSVGLNDVDLAVRSDNVRYRVRYPWWTICVLALSALLGVVLAAFFLLYDLRDYLARQSWPSLFGLSMDQSVAVAWGSVVFWGFVWPWILIALHKRPLRRLIERIIVEVDKAAEKPS